MSKNPKDREKHRQKKLAKQKANRGTRLAAFKAEQARRAVYQAKMRTMRLEQAKLLQDGQQVPVLSDEDYLFWLCHGANYLASDSSTGVWAPIFEDIYQGTLPNPESVAQKVLATYQEALETEGKFGGVPRAVLAWTVTDRNIVSVYKHEAVRRLREKDPECEAEVLARTPHNPVVWSLMDKVKERSLAAGAEMDAEPAPVTEEA